VDSPRHCRARRLSDDPSAALPTFATLTDTVPIAVVTFQFDPYAHLFGDLAIRWAAIALTVVIVAGLLLAALLARADDLRPDDVAFIAIGIVPGAVIGGRLGYFFFMRATTARRRISCSIRRSAGWSSDWPWSAAS